MPEDEEEEEEEEGEEEEEELSDGVQEAAPEAAEGEAAVPEAPAEE